MSQGEEDSEAIYPNRDLDVGRTFAISLSSREEEVAWLSRCAVGIVRFPMRLSCSKIILLEKVLGIAR